MTDPAGNPPTPGPSRRDRTRPAELIGLSAVLATVLGLVVLAATRTLLLALEFFGVGFIASLVVMAMLLLAVAPKDRGGKPPEGGH